MRHVPPLFAFLRNWIDAHLLSFPPKLHRRHPSECQRRGPSSFLFFSIFPFPSGKDERVFFFCAVSAPFCRAPPSFPLDFLPELRQTWVFRPPPFSRETNKTNPPPRHIARPLLLLFFYGGRFIRSLIYRPLLCIYSKPLSSPCRMLSAGERGDRPFPLKSLIDTNSGAFPSLFFFHDPQRGCTRRPSPPSWSSPRARISLIQTFSLARGSRRLGSSTKMKCCF